MYEKERYGKAIATKLYDSMDTDKIKAAALESIFSGGSETGDKRLGNLTNIIDNLIELKYKNR